MTANSLHISDQFPRILNEFNTILNLHTEDGDNLYVSEGTLHINQGGFLQGPTRTLYNLIKEGYNYNDVVAHLETFQQLNVEYLRELSTHQISLSDLKVFQRRVHQVAIKMSNLKGVLRGIIPDTVYDRIGDLFHAFKAQSDSLKQFINQNKPEGWQPPRIPLDLDEPVRYRKLMHRMPRGATILDVIQLAETAEAQATIPRENTSEIAMTAVVASIASVASFPFTIFQFALWKPFKFLTGQYDEGRTPMGWIVDNVITKSRNMNVDPSALLNSYAMALLKVPVVQEEHVVAFCALARHIDTSLGMTGPIYQYELASDNVEELLEIAQSSLSMDELITDVSLLSQRAEEILELVIGSQLITSDQIGAYLTNHFDKLQWVDDPSWEPATASTRFNEWKQAYQGSNDVEERQNYYLQTSGAFDARWMPRSTLISLNNLLRVINAVVGNPRCTQFDTVTNMHHIPRIHDRLTECGFVLTRYKYIRQPAGGLGAP